MAGKKKKRSKTKSKNNNNTSRKDDTIEAQHSHFFTPRGPKKILANKPGYYIFINPYLDNSVSNKICDSIVNNIAPNYDIQQVWMHPRDTLNQWQLRDLPLEIDGNKKHWKKTYNNGTTYFSQYQEASGAYKLFNSVINRLKFENYISWGAESDDKYYACGEWLNPGFFNHTNARKDCAFVMVHYTTNQEEMKKRYNRFIELVGDALKNGEETYIEKYIDPKYKDSLIKFWKNTSEKRQNSSLRATMSQKDIFGTMINGGFLYVRDLNFKDGKFNPRGADYLYIEGICSSKFAKKAKRRGNNSTRLKNDIYKIIVPHYKTGKMEASPGLEFVDMTNIISYMSGYKGTKLSALIHVINFYFSKFNFKFLQQSAHNIAFRNPQQYENQDYVDELVANLKNDELSMGDPALRLEYQKLFNFDGIIRDSASVTKWPQRYRDDWARRIENAKGNLGLIRSTLEREAKRYQTFDVGDDGFNQYFIWHSFDLPVIKGQNLTQVTKAIMADANPIYADLLKDSKPSAPQQQRQSICQRGMEYIEGTGCVLQGGRRRTRRRRKNKKKRTKKKARRRKKGGRKSRKRRKRRKSRR